MFTTAVDGIKIEIIDLLVGPERTSEPMRLQAGALLDVQGGKATLIADGRMRRVKPGVVVRLAKNQNIVIDNSRATRPLSARLILISRPGG